MLPLSLLKTAQGHPVVSAAIWCMCCSHAWQKRRWTHHSWCLQLVELKNGETYNGHLVLCDTWMNIHLREVICTSKVCCARGG